MSGKNLVLKLNTRMLSANQIAGFLNCNISKTFGGIKLILHAGTYILKFQIDDVILGGHAQVCPSMHKEAIKNLRSQKLEEM